MLLLVFELIATQKSKEIKRLHNKYLDSKVVHTLAHLVFHIDWNVLIYKLKNITE